MLRSEGFILCTMYDEYGDAESRIVDPVMICDCGFKNRVLLAGDQDLIYTWANEIVRAGIAVFVTTDNNESPKQWGPRITAAQNDMLRELGRREKPFTARISREGQVTQVRVYKNSEWKTITLKRKRPSNFYRKK
jgi:hypothetical protein